MTETPVPGGQSLRPENLPLAFQEVLTAVVRVRANRPVVTDARLFRANMREAIKAAVHSARQYGYSDEEIQLALLAAVGFLDESILNSQNPVFSDWPRETLSHELFHHQLLGEVVFDKLQRLLGMQDSAGLAGVLEVYRLCLLLGFTGKFGAGNRGEITALADLAKQKILRIRGVPETLFPPELEPGAVKLQARRDTWSRRLLVVALVCLCLAVVSFVAFNTLLGSGLGQLQTITPQQTG